jgi:FkbM family methyltransferase
MFLLKAESFHSETPLYTKLRDDDTLLVPEARVGKDYFHTGIYERNYIQWAVSNYARPDKEILDIGAHIGLYTVELAKLAKRVHSFECSPKSFNYLCANIALRNLNYKVTTYPTALSDKPGRTPYYIRDPGDGGGNGISFFPLQDSTVATVDVPMTTLDAYELSNINFIKIDVEGHEEQVLRGGVQTLQRNGYPPILFESWPERMTSVPARELRASLFTFLISLGYTVTQLQGGTDDMFLASQP